jgi:hypothetical protein
MLSSMQKRIEAGAIKDVPFVRKRFLAGSVSNEVHSGPRLERHLPYPNDADYPTGSANRCAEWFYEQGLLKTEVSDNSGNPIAPTFDILRAHISQLMSAPLRGLIEKHQSTQFQARPLETLLRRYLRYRRREESELTWFMPLYALRIPTHQVKLAEFGVISKCSDHLKADFWNRFGGSLEFHISAQMFASAQLAFFFRGKLEGPKKQTDRNECGASVLTALRLCKEGKVGTSGVCHVPRGPGGVGGGFSVFPDAGMFDVFGAVWDAFELDLADLKRFRTLFARLSKEEFKLWKALRQPLTRFNRTYLRASREDEVIDLVICLETLLLPNERDELKYRLSLRGAKLLSATRNPQDIRAFLGKVYDTRSDIVHNGKTLSQIKPKDGIDVRGPQFVNDLRHLVRDVLSETIRLMSAGKSLQELCADLDRQILQGIARRARS